MANKTPVFSVRLTAEQYQWLKEYAERTQQPVNAIVKQSLDILRLEIDNNTY